MVLNSVSYGCVPNRAFLVMFSCSNDIPQLAAAQALLMFCVCSGNYFQTEPRISDRFYVYRPRARYR